MMARMTLVSFVGGPIRDTYGAFDDADTEAMVAALPSAVGYWPRGQYVLRNPQDPQHQATREAHWVTE